MTEKFYWEKGSKDSMRLDIPGFEKDEIHVHLTKNSISVKASKKTHFKEHHRGFYAEEVSVNTITKSVMLPHQIDPKSYEVKITDGIVLINKRKKAHNV